MRGLTSEEVADRKARGLANDADVRTSRTYTDIFVKNAFTPFNVILFILGILLVICDEVISAISATGIIIVNILISTIQEMRAKRKLDRISLLVRPKVTVVRDGGEMEIDQAEIVVDDLIVIRAGEQALVDGIADRCKSSTVRKHEGDKVYSGSVCVTGEMYYTVTAVGNDAYASQMLKSARKFTSKETPLQMETGTMTKILMVIAAILFVLTIFKSILFTHENLGQTLEVFVLCLDVVPIALFLLITLTYMIAAARMADSGVLLQRANSVESISHVDTVCMDKTGTITTNRLCMDKTGTITTNRLAFERSEDFVPSDEASRYASVFATLTGSKNRTMQAIVQHYGEADAELVEEIQFSSERKFSAVRARDGDRTYTMYVGAWTVLGPHCRTDLEIQDIIDSESRKGLRTVLLCLGGDGPLHDDDGNPVIHDLVPVSVISIRDEVRPDCRDTIQVFLDNGMDLKVISGDDPVTVDSLFTIADIPGKRRIISGPELDAMDPETFERTVLETNIFGRMRPENKQAVIETLKKNGRYVAMIGDGVNDVKSLKTAQVGVALESGSGAARGVADMVLVKDNFSALPKALVEGRRTVSGMRDILKIYLTRNLVLALLFIAIYIFVGYLPMLPIQNTYYAFVSVTIMAFFMTLFAKPDNNKELILPDVLRFCVPSAIMIAAFGLAVYGGFWWLQDQGMLNIDWAYMASIHGTDIEGLLDFYSWGTEVNTSEIVARSAMLFFITTAGILQMLLVSPRYRFLSPDGRTNKSLIPIILVVFVFLVIYAMYAYFPAIAVNLVELVIFPNEVFLLLIGITAVWFFAELFVLKKNVFKHAVDRFETLYMKKLQDAYTEGDVKEDD